MCVFLTLFLGLQIEGLLMANNRLLCSDKDVKAIGTGFSQSTCWRISRAPRHAVYLQDMQQRNLCSESDGRVFLGKSNDRQEDVLCVVLYKHKYLLI